jgi:hypothetical protein
MKYLLVIAALMLGGCAEMFSAITQDVGDARNLTRNYLGGNAAERQAIRYECAQILREEVDALKAEGKYDEARALLQASYPPIVTFGTIKKIRRGESPSDILNTAWTCGKGEQE